MTTQIRRLIFYILIVIFFILTFFIIPYSNGWHFDFDTFKFVKLGGLYLNVEPTEAKIQVDKLNFEIKSGFMKSGILIANLFPKTYYVSIQKDGYQSWNKNLSVKPSLVTEIYPIILVPEKSNEEFVKNGVVDFFPNLNYLAWKDINNKLKIDGKIIKGTKFIAWLAGEKSALVYDETTKNYLVINPAQNNSALNINLLFENLKYQKTIDDKTLIKKAIAHPIDKNKLILNTNKNLYILDFYKSSIGLIQNGPYELFGANNEEIFFTDSNNLYLYDLNKNERSILLALDKDNINSLEVSPNNQLVAFSKNNKTFLLDRSKNKDNQIDLLIQNPSHFKFSPDSKKIAVTYDDNKIRVFLIGDDHELFNKKLMGFSSFEINYTDSNPPITWHNNSCYLFVKSETSLKFLEINDDQPINLQTIDTNIDKYFYNKVKNSIYLIRGESLYEITK